MVVDGWMGDVCMCVHVFIHQEIFFKSGKKYTNDLLRMVTNLKYRSAMSRRILFFILCIYAVLAIILYHKGVMFYNVEKEKKL